MPQTALSPCLCVGSSILRGIFSFPGPVFWFPESTLTSNHRFPFLLGISLLIPQKGDRLLVMGSCPFLGSSMSMWTNLILRLFPEQCLLLCVNRASTCEWERHSCTSKPTGFCLLLKIICMILSVKAFHNSKVIDSGGRNHGNFMEKKDN